MATVAANDAPGFIAPGDIIPLDPNEIDLGERLRPVDEDFAGRIGQSMKIDGQLHTVDVRKMPSGGWQLAGAGGHRVVGARLANIPIDCKVVVFGQDVARRREAAENLFRRANDPIERAEAIAELVRLHREQAGIQEAGHREQSMPKRLRAEAAGTLEIFSNVYGWSEEIGAKIGFTGRTVRNDLFLYRSLIPSVIAQLRDRRHPVLTNAAQLRALAKLGPADQVMASNQLIGGAKNITEAVGRVNGKPAADPEAKRLSTFIGTFKRMSLSEKRGALAQLAGMLPAPFKLVEEKQ